MFMITELNTGQAITVSEQPCYINGVWECGDQRFTDPLGTQYEFIATAAQYPILTPMAFYLRFQVQERISIKASQDPVVKEFWATYLLALQTNSTIDMNRLDTRMALDYMSTEPAGTPILVAGRKAEILAVD